MTPASREAAYLAQTGRATLTVAQARQARRMRHRWERTPFIDPRRVHVDPEVAQPGGSNTTGSAA